MKGEFLLAAIMFIAGAGGEVVNFDDGIKELEKYKATHGDVLVPQATAVMTSTGVEIKLGKWVQRQRQLYKNTFVTPRARKGFGQMAEEQRSKLEQLGFNFELPEELRAPPAVDWDAAYNELQSYHSKHGDCNVPQGTVVTTSVGTEIRLGKWVQVRALLELPIPDFARTFVTMNDNECNNFFTNYYIFNGVSETEAGI